MSEDTRFARISALFDELVDLPPAERDARLRALESDAAIIAEVEAMLAADARGDSFQSAAAALRAQATLAVADAVDSGERFGAWRVVRELGQGGMGTVLLVERDAGGFEQRGALKLIRRGLDSEAIVARFLRERQLLARLDHPHIARVIDGGITDDGRPYFVMEYVEGEPLLERCARPDADLARRLTWFEEIASAVAFAHRHLIVHRDIKPGNVLVTADGSAKLLDFGIAKLLEADVDDDATRTHGGPLTPQYASPEQLRGQPVSTLTDVYGLGALLYEILSGQRPYPLGDASSPVDWVRVLEGPECPLASRAATLPDPRVPPVPPAALRGDLDTILQVALRREAERRYPSVDALAGDLDRYRRGFAIGARRDRWRYRAGKFLARHRAAAALVSLAFVALVGALAFALVQARQARLEAQRAASTRDFLVGLFQSADPGSNARANQLSAKEMVDIGARQVADRLRDDPTLAADVHLMLGTIYVSLSEYDAAIAQLATPVAGGASETPTVRHARLYQLANAQIGKHDLETAKATAATLLDSARAHAAEDPVSVSRALRTQAEIARHEGAMTDAARLAREAYDAAHRDTPDGAIDAGHALISLGGVQWESQQNADARASLDEALTLFARAGASQSIPAIQARGYLGILAQQAGDLDTALASADAYVAELRTQLPDTHHEVINAIGNRAALYSRVGRIDEAVDEFRRALVLAERAYGASSPERAGLYNGLGTALADAGRDAEAATAFASSLAAWRAIGEPEPSLVATLTANRARALANAGDLAATEPLAREAVALSRAADGADSWRYARKLDLLAMVLREANRLDESLAASAESLAVTAKIPELDPAIRIGGLTESARTKRAAGRYDAALADLDAARAIARRRESPDQTSLAAIQCDTAQTLVAAGRHDAAKPIADECAALLASAYATQPARAAIGTLAQAEVAAHDPAQRDAAIARARDAVATIEAAFGTAHVYARGARRRLDAL